MSSDVTPDVSALAINVTIPDLVAEAASRAGALWTAHRGLG